MPPSVWGYVLMMQYGSDTPELYRARDIAYAKVRAREVMSKRTERVWTAVIYEQNPCPARDKLEMSMVWNPWEHEWRDV